MQSDDKEFVLRCYPEAFSVHFGMKWTVCNHKRIHEIGHGATESAAWSDARKKIEDLK